MADAALRTDLPGRSLAAGSQISGRSIAVAGLVVFAGVVASRLLGWVRASVLFAEFGAGRDLDAFNAAFRIPDTLFQLVAASAVGSALIPVASELLAHGEEERARRLVSTVANLMLLVLVPIALILWVLSPTLVPIIAPGFDAAELRLTTSLTQLMLLSSIALAVGAVVAAALNTVGVFGPSSLAPNVYNIAIIVAAVVLSPWLGIYALGVGVVLGAFGHVAVQMPSFLSRRLYRPVVSYRDPAVRETLLLMAPRALGLGVTQIVFLVNNSFASGLGGAIALYAGAFTVLQIPVGLIGVPLGIVLLPPMSRAVAEGATERFAVLVDRSLRLLLYLSLPITGLMLILSRPLITLLYEHGKFSAADTAGMQPILAFFLFGLVAHVLIALLAPIFYAGKDTRTPVTAAVLAVVVDVVAANVLFGPMGLSGLALAIGLGAWAEVAVLLLLVERRLGLDLRPLARALVTLVPGAVLASLAAYLVASSFGLVAGGRSSSEAVLVQFTLAGGAGVGVYAGWSRMLGIEELEASLGIMRAIVRRA